MPYVLTPPPMNPLARILAALLAVLALVGAFFFGIFILAVVVGLAVLGWLFMTVRIWWLRRTGQMPQAAPGIIEAEYSVVSRSDRDSSTDSPES